MSKTNDWRDNIVYFSIIKDVYLDETYDRDIHTDEVIKGELPPMIGIMGSIGVRVVGRAITHAMWNRKVNHDDEAVGIINDFANEKKLTVICELPNVLPLSTIPPVPATAKEFFRKFNIDATPEQIEDFQGAMDKAKAKRLRGA